MFATHGRDRKPTTARLARGGLLHARDGASTIQKEHSLRGARLENRHRGPLEHRAPEADAFNRIDGAEFVPTQCASADGAAVVAASDDGERRASRITNDGAPIEPEDARRLNPHRPAARLGDRAEVVDIGHANEGVPGSRAVVRGVQRASDMKSVAKHRRIAAAAAVVSGGNIAVE